MRDQLSDWRWRINNLYWIQDKKGQRVKFQMNWAQEALFSDMHYLNIVLKARQLGMSTEIDILLLDAAIFNSDIRAGVIADTRDNAKELFRTKVKFPYDNLPEGIRNANPADKASAQQLTFANGSSIVVGTSLRGGTYQYLHISEFGKICAQFPEKAREIRTGALNTVQAGQFIFIESTAEGQEGDFYEMCQTAQGKQRAKTALTELDYKFHFFPWWKHPEYALSDYNAVTVTKEHDHYFQSLAAQGINLTRQQKAWYVLKLETQREDMKREYPSTPEEAFEASIEGVIYAQEMAEAEEEGRITSVPFDKAHPVEVDWDLGISDDMALIAKQRIGQEVHYINCVSGNGYPIPHYAGILDDWRQKFGYRYSVLNLPHDAKTRSMEREDAATREKVLQELGFKTFIVKQHGVWDGIDTTRNQFPFFWFDKQNCAELIHAIKHYRKEWDEKRGVWRDVPRHDSHSHYADALRTGAMAPRDKHRRKRQKIDYDKYLHVT